MKRNNQNEDYFYKNLYQNYINQLFSYGLSFGLAAEKVSDAIHDVFLNYIEKDIYSNLIDNHKLYLFRSLRNRLISSERNKQQFDDIDSKENISFSLENTSLQNLIEKEEYQALSLQVERLMQCLTTRQKEAIYLHFILEQSYEEVADLMHLTPKGVRKLISRAIIRMRKDGIIILSS